MGPLLMTVLHLGVLDIPYTAGTKKVAVSTTGDVAEWLEDKYHVYQHFFEAHGVEIAEELTQSLKDFFEDQLSGSPANAVSFTAAESEIKHLFTKFIDTKEMDRLGYPGIPTKASLAGVNHRMKHPYAKRGPRPSFKDTGTYEAAFKAWLEE